MKALKAILILCVYAVFLCIAMPGVSFLKTSFLRTPKRQAAFEARHGTVATHLALMAVEVNDIRKPIARQIGGFQPLFRIRQSWHLYRDGPSTIRRMEVMVDDTVVYRTGDSERDWNVDVFSNRRIRPMAETFAKKPKAKNPRGLIRYTIHQARLDFPDATRIEVRSTWARRGKPSKVHHRFVAQAPEWVLEAKP